MELQESCRDTAQVTVTINALTTVDAGLDVSICEGDSIQLNASGAASLFMDTC